MRLLGYLFDRRGSAAAGLSASGGRCPSLADTRPPGATTDVRLPRGLGVRWRGTAAAIICNRPGGDRRAANDPSRVPSRRAADRPRGELDSSSGLSTRLLDKNSMTFNLQSRPLQGGCFVIPAFSRKGERGSAEHLCRRSAGRRDRWGPSRPRLRQPALQTWTRSLTCIIARSQGNTTFLKSHYAFSAVTVDPHLVQWIRIQSDPEVGTVYGIIFSDPELDQDRHRQRICTNYGTMVQ